MSKFYPRFMCAMLFMITINTASLVLVAGVWLNEYTAPPLNSVGACIKTFSAAGPGPMICARLYREDKVPRQRSLPFSGPIPDVSGAEPEAVIPRATPKRRGKTTREFNV